MCLLGLEWIQCNFHLIALFLMVIVYLQKGKNEVSDELGIGFKKESFVNK